MLREIQQSLLSPPSPAWRSCLLHISSMHCPTSRHTASTCNHYASFSMLLTNPIHIPGLLKELELILAAHPRNSTCQNDASFFPAAAAESGKPLLKEVWHAIRKQQHAVLNLSMFFSWNSFSSPLRFYMDLVGYVGTNLFQKKGHLSFLATQLA